METQKKISLEQVVELLPSRVSLVYIDYRDSLDGHEEKIQECIHERNFDSLFELVDDCFMEAEWEGLDYVLKELKDDVERTFDIEDAEYILEEYKDELRDEIYDRCDDDVIEDLLRNTGSLIAHYDTGYEVPGGSWNWSEAQVRLERMKLKKHLSIDHSDFDDDMDMMIRQASYGGQVLVYFHMNPRDFINIKDGVKSIQFTDASIGIIDHCNGSGDVMDLHGHSFVLPYNQENVFLEKTIKYNWTYSIAGMVSSWCDGTVYHFETMNVGEIERSSANDLIDREKQYNKTYQSGGCTPGDMDIRRHRNVTYINDFPCGNKCKDCGTFWID